LSDVTEIEVENLHERDRGHHVEEASFAEEGEIFGMVGLDNTGETTTVEGANDPRPTADSLCP
jgi:ABC-type Na+ transport system ATPase subunit NatA